MAVAAEIQVRDRLYIGGEWVEPAGRETIDVVNSTTEEVMGRDPGGHAGGRRPRGRGGARRRSRRGRRRRSSERAELLRAIAAGLAGAQRGDRARLIAQEVGMPIGLSHDDPGRPADDDVRLDAAAARARSPGRSRSATRWSCASRSAWSARSRRGTTRCTRSPRRSRRRSPPAARSCSSRARSRR